MTEDDDDDENESNDCMSWPVVGKGGKVNKGVKESFGKREEHQHFKKFDFTSEIEEVKFIGAVEDERAGGAAMGLSFQATDVRKPLLAVKRITEKGNVVQFGPAESDNYIKNVRKQDPGEAERGVLRTGRFVSGKWGGVD